MQTQNHGDPFVFYDQIADRWVISRLRFSLVPWHSILRVHRCVPDRRPRQRRLVPLRCPGGSGEPDRFWAIIPSSRCGTMAEPENAYFLTMNVFTNATTFNWRARLCARSCQQCIGGGPANAIGFTIVIAGCGRFLQLGPCELSHRRSAACGKGRISPRYRQSRPGGVTLTQVHGWMFHVDFANPANSTFGVGADHTPNAEITVNGFVDAFTEYDGQPCATAGNVAKAGYLGDKIMTPVVYQNRNGTESLWADHTVNAELPATGRLLFAGINSMLPAAIFLLPLFNSKTGPMATTVYGAGCPA